MAAGSEYAAGTTGGSNAVTLSAEQIPSLNISGSSSSRSVTYSGATTTYNGSTGSSGEHTHAASNTTVNVLVNGAVTNYIYSAGTTAGFTYGNLQTVTTGSSGAHTHTFTIPSLAVSGSLTIPALSVASSYSNTSQRDVAITNKYVSVYMWKRIA